MTLEKIRETAKGLGIPAAKMKKDDIIRKIQAAEGNFPCFKTATNGCDQMNCLWRKDCLG